MFALAIKENFEPCPFLKDCGAGTQACRKIDTEYCVPIPKKPRLVFYIKIETKICCPKCGNTDRRAIETNSGNGPFYTCYKCGEKKTMVCFITPKSPVTPKIHENLGE